MSTDNPFILPVTEYKRDLNFLNHYVEQSATYLSQMRGISREEAIAFVKLKIVPNAEHAFKDVPIEHTAKTPTGDREIQSSGLASYIFDAVKNRDIIAPTLTRYIHPEILESPLVSSIDKNVANRNVNKKMMFEARARDDEALAIAKNGEQTGNKLSNNALSGAHVSASTPLFNKTGHSSLTSTCRITSGFGNANNEKLLSGNRHYWHYTVALNNIASITTNTDYEQFEAVMRKYNLHYPTNDETFDVIAFSALQYMRGEKSFKPIRDYVDKLTPIECAAVVYTGDLYHVLKFNEPFMREFISQLAKRIVEPLPEDEAAAVIKAADDDFISLASQLQGPDMRGVLLRDIKGSTLYGQVAATIKNVRETLWSYQDFIHAIMVSKNVPASLAYFPASIRHCAITSDTDSTIFTVQDWIKWYRGDYILDEEGIAAMAVMVFIASQSIIHLLAMMSANIGVQEDRMFQIAMKNEYRYDVFVPTNETKHYYAIIGCQEGNVYKDYKQEIKGVHLRSSKVSKDVMAAAADQMRAICETVARGEKISITDALAHIHNQEEHIFEDVRKGNSGFFRFEQVKTAEAYQKGPSDSPYQHYTMWRDVFAPKYGETEPPPYTAMKLNSTVTTDTAFRAWLDELPDQALANRFRAWLAENNKTCIRTFLLPMNLIKGGGIPTELHPLIDMRRLAVDNMGVFYKIMETLSFHMLNEHISLLLSDHQK